MTRWNRRLLFGAMAMLVPVLVGCEAGLNAPTLQYHPPNFTANKTACAPYFVEVAHRCGHRFTDVELRRKADALVDGVVHALGMRTGIVHLEFRVDAHGPVVMEVAVRTPGDYIMELLRMTYGFDPYSVAIALALDLQRYMATWNDARVDLTVTEFMMLHALVRHPGHVKSRKQLTKEGYPNDTYVSDRTIDTHIKRLRRKFEEADPSFAAIETVYGVGYRWVA